MQGPGEQESAKKTRHPTTPPATFPICENLGDLVGAQTRFAVLIYNVDETGLQLCYDSPEKVLAQKGSKRVCAATNAENGETVSVVACVNETGTNWIPPFVIFKGKNKKLVYGDGLPPGSVCAMIEKGYMQTKEFCNWLHHFNKHRLLGKVLLILDVHASHQDESVLDTAESLIQPLGKGSFKALKTYWTEAVDTFRRANPGAGLNVVRQVRMASGQFRFAGHYEPGYVGPCVDNSLAASLNKRMGRSQYMPRVKGWMNGAGTCLQFFAEWAHYHRELLQA
ncbi:hypothetical protein PR048_006134 [Dryococelus australis]|uniref:DDE-1 domain-containing protein n=1 Tax=Dryococelus australis TaxID=614101 RepID=A0ABQ9IA72_9NEOP|nr:hypothetical protein PR048_006134 [Dryococelus australis]